MKTVQQVFALIFTGFVATSGCRTAATSKTGDAADLNLQAMLRPVPITAIMSDSAYFISCGTMVCGNDGTCHSYYSCLETRTGVQCLSHTIGSGPRHCQKPPWSLNGVLLPNGRIYTVSNLKVVGRSKHSPASKSQKIRS